MPFQFCQDPTEVRRHAGAVCLKPPREDAGGLLFRRRTAANLRAVEELHPPIPGTSPTVSQVQGMANVANI